MAKWRLLETPNPTRCGIGIIIPQDEVASNPAGIPQIEDSLKDLSFGIPESSLATDDTFGLYQYTSYRMIGEKESASFMFMYGPNLTDTEKNTPYRSSWRKHGNHRWPPILKGIILLEDNSFPRSTNYVSNGQAGVALGPAYYDRVVYIPDTNEGTRFLMEEFFSATKFSIPRYQTPVATAVQYSVNGLNGSFPECLHDDIEIPATRTATATYYGGQDFSGNGSVEGQFFPRTNFKRWRPYVLLDEQEQQDAGWYRQRIRVFPPAMPKQIRR